jgi:hypothetical protein
MPTTLFFLLLSHLTPARGASLRISARGGPHPPGATLAISVIELGGDPTGALDASPSFDAAIAAAAAVQNASADDWSLGSHRVLIDLGGGVYNLSRSITLFGRPSSAVTLAGGALVAGAAFPSGNFAVEVGGWAEGVHLEELTIDMRRRGGGVRVNGAEATVLRNLKVVHFSTWGLLGDDAAGKSNELFVSDSEFGEYMWGEPGFNVTAAQNGTGIEMRFYDSHFYNTIVRCTKTGIVDSAGSNLYHGMHVYATCNKDPAAVNVAVGFLLSGESTRISNCNWDDSPVVICGNGLVDLLLQGNIFYGLSNLTLLPEVASAPYARVAVTGNAFRGTSYAPSPAIHTHTNAPGARALSLNNLIVADNLFSNGSVARATRSTVALPVTLPAAPARPCPPATLLVDAAARLLFAPPPPLPPLTAFAGIAGSLVLTGAPPGEVGAWGVALEGGLVNATVWRMGGGGVCAEVTGVLTLTFDQQLAAPP